MSYIKKSFIKITFSKLAIIFKFSQGRITAKNWEKKMQLTQLCLVFKQILQWLFYSKHMK